jgi:hypothetical protein
MIHTPWKQIVPLFPRHERSLQKPWYYPTLAPFVPRLTAIQTSRNEQLIEFVEGNGQWTALLKWKLLPRS